MRPPPVTGGGRTAFTDGIRPRLRLAAAAVRQVVTWSREHPDEATALLAPRND